MLGHVIGAMVPAVITLCVSAAALWLPYALPRWLPGARP